MFIQVLYVIFTFLDLEIYTKATLSKLNFEIYIKVVKAYWYFVIILKSDYDWHEIDKPQFKISTYGKGNEKNEFIR